MRFTRPAILCVVIALQSGCQRTWGDPDQPGGTGTPLPANLIGIGLSPVNPKVVLGEDIQFTATGFYSDQRTVEVTDTVEWASSEPSILSISGALDQEGFGSTLGPGKAQVRANFFDIESNVVTVTVTDALIESLTVSPATAQLAVASSLQLAAEAEFSDGTRGNVNGSVRWLSSDGGIATVDVSGKVVAIGIGTAEIAARYEQAEEAIDAEPVIIDVVGEGTEVAQADVRVVGLSAAPGPDGATFTVSVRNSGGAAASAFWVDVWLNRTAAPDPPPTSGDAYEYIDLLEAGESIELPILVEATAGNYQSWAMADSFANVVEGSLGENNNVWGPQATPITTGGGPIGPDVTVSYLQVYVQAEQVLYVIDVTNTGDEPALDFGVGVFTNPGFPPAPGQTPDEVAEIATLLPGETASLAITVRALPEIPWQSYVLADSDGHIVEPNEMNNVEGSLVFP